MSKAQICPVCNGRGKVIEIPQTYQTAGTYEKICYGCNGKGWIEVND